MMMLGSHGTRRACAAVLAMALSSGGGHAADSDTTSDWLLEPHEGVVRLRLVHQERTRPDGGELLVDANRRVVIWEGIPGEYGCREKLEVPFESVRAVRDEPEGLIHLEIQGQPRGRWVFVPLPHAAWIVQARSPLITGINPEIREGFRGPDGETMTVGGWAAFAGPQLRQGRVPAEVTNDVRLAVERIRDTLGQHPVPSIELYEALNGKPVEVSIPELVEEPHRFEGRAVRVYGLAEPLPDGRGLTLSDEGRKLRAVPQPEIEAVVGSLVRDWRGQEVEVAGVVKRRSGGTNEAPPEIGFWEYLGPERVRAATDAAPAVEIGDLLERASEYKGRTVRVAGRFRGSNLEHDLDTKGPRSAWVIKSGRDAIWVTGHKPAGRGFTLREDLPQDMTRWVEIVGRLETWKGEPVLKARTVALTAPASSIQRGPRLRAPETPEVVFTLPLVGYAPVAENAVFLVQFSTYMDEATFEDHVRLRYGDRPGPEGELRSVRWRYDDVKRTLIVDPGERLRAGASVELQLLRGIASDWAVPLVPAATSPPGDVVTVLRWQVQTRDAGS
jgi:hypothetical protein